MRNTKKDFTLGQRFCVVGILAMVGFVVVKNLPPSAKETDDRNLSSAATDYSTTKQIYAAGIANPPVTRIQVAMGTEANHGRSK